MASPSLLFPRSAGGRRQVIDASELLSLSFALYKHGGRSLQWILVKLGTTSHTWETGLAVSLPPLRREGQIGKGSPPQSEKISNWAGRWCLFYSIFLATECPLSPCSFFDNYPQLKMGLESTCFYSRMTFSEAKPLWSDGLPYEERISLGTLRTRVNKRTNAKTDRVVVCFS